MATEQARGILLGLALGDALGFPVEFLKLAQIRDRYGADGITAPPDPALYSDDTQMTVALTEALIRRGEADIDSLMGVVGEEFVKWMHSPENTRAPGNTCMAGTRNFESGIPWRKSGLPGSKGCGSAMRVAPIGYLYRDNPERLEEVAHASGIITHGHPTAVVASIAAAYLVKLALDGTHPDEWVDSLKKVLAGRSAAFDRVLWRIEQAELNPNRDIAVQSIGEGWVGEEAVGMALYCLRQFPDDYPAVVRLAANITGDSDSVACIAGGISAARLGIDAIPEDWIARCENESYLTELGGRLAQKRELLRKN